MIEPLLHLVTGLEWRAALHAGAVTPPSLVTDGFVHLSRPDQVALPANRLFAGRTDLLLLVLDPERLGAEVRWEPGVPTDPESMRFPHLYGPLPVGAVTSVVPYRPDGDGGAFGAPVGLPAPDDRAARALAFDRSLVERRAAVLLPVTGGVAVLDPRVSSSYEHNALWIGGDAGEVDAATITADADRVLVAAGCRHRRVVSDRPLPPDLGWDPTEHRVLVHDAGAALPDVTAPVESVTGEVMARLWGPSWRRDIPGISDEAVEHLIRREGIADAHVAVTHLTVLSDDDGGGVPVAAAQLRIDGATAAIEEVMTDPATRQRGYGTAVVVDAIGRARAAGCDVVLLVADADDWPRRWYERLGFVDVGGRWEATLSGGAPLPTEP